jgi:hypothetical protein
VKKWLLPITLVIIMSRLYQKKFAVSSLIGLYRYEVDMAFYMSPNELFEVKERVINVVTEAIVFVEHHSRAD